MSREEEVFFKKLLSIFHQEASEHLQKMVSTLIELEKTEPKEERKKKIEIIYRSLHTLKGASASVEINAIEFLCQSLENLLAQFLKQPSFHATTLFNLIHKTIDRLVEIKKASESGQTGLQQPEDFQLIQEIEAFSFENSPSLPVSSSEFPIPTPVVSLTPISTTNQTNSSSQITGANPSPQNLVVKIPAERLAQLLRQAEETMSIQWSEAQKVEDLQSFHRQLLSWEKEWSKIVPSFHKLQKLEGIANKDLQKLLIFLEWNLTHFQALESSFKTLLSSSFQSLLSTKRMVNQLLESTKEMLMLPCSEIFEGIPKVIRDLALKQNKKIRLVLHGGDIEIDKRVLDELRDPILHLVRNSIDHSLEGPAERLKYQKSEEGQISITITPQENQKIKITFADDGAGISIEKLKASVLKNGFLTEKDLEKMSTQQVQELIFLSGISTSSHITSVSGRGLGLTIVRDHVEKLGGTISVESLPYQGTTFHLLLPLTLSMFRGVLVRVCHQIFVVPTMYVQRVFKQPLSELKTVENQKMIEFQGQAIPLIWLQEVLELTPVPKIKQNAVMVMMIKMASTTIAFVVDEILQEQEILTKSLGKQLVRVRNISGGTILGSGEIAFILNMADLVQSCLQKNTQRISLASDPPEDAMKTILVVEDSITARMLVKNVLELAGYGVEIAVDGTEALQKIETQKVDLVLTDIEMPRMNGLNLCHKIRTDTRFLHLPVVLLSALESEEDRKRGFEVGADAYLVKSNFEQNTLLETVRRLL